MSSGGANPVRYYCTYFNRNYLVQGCAMWRSLRAHAENSRLYVLCFDEFTFDVLTKLNEPGLVPIALSDFERGDTALLAAKEQRSFVEYFFTCSPSLPLYVLNHFAEVDIVTYLDADLLFFSSPEPLFEELGEGSVSIIGHRFPERNRDLEKFGIYNVSWLSFRRDAIGLACLQWWRERCLEWCSDEAEDGKFADQKYLDDWPTRFGGVVVVQHKGADLAPWNWMNDTIDLGTEPISIGGQPLIFYHYQGLKIFNSWLYDPVTLGHNYGEMPLPLRRRLYKPYIEALKSSSAVLRGIDSACGLVYSRSRLAGYNWRKLFHKLRGRRLLIGRNIR